MSIPGDVVTFHGGRVWYEVRQVFDETEDHNGRVLVDRHGVNARSVTLTIPGQAWRDILAFAATVQNNGESK